MKVRVTALMALLCAGPLQAQDGCTYDQCAMRIEMDGIVIGRTGATKVKFGFFHAPNLRAQLASSDSAMAQYRIVTANHVSGNVLSMLGGLAAGFALFASTQDPRLGSGRFVIGSAILGVAGGAVGSRKIRKARNALARAVWWYNRDLPR